jgi:hypothetical protein
LRSDGKDGLLYRLCSSCDRDLPCYPRRRLAIYVPYVIESSSGRLRFVQGYTADTERIVETLIEAGAVAIKGYGEGMNTEFGLGLTCQPAPMARDVPG